MNQFKNQREVLEALLAGKKVRSIHWSSKDSFVMINDEDKLVGKDGSVWSTIPYYGEAEIYTPSKKKKVTKTVEAWMNVYPSGNSHTYSSEESADQGSNSSRIACVKLTGTYEVEE